ncbi:glycerophosphodiester phosphodiesterase family protein [Roseivirga sp. E12]|uniref:glycerophosphodiester phosphodiesterase family protein n=1 Tax=Roseivirga sp. E12 TaxID=2819237 RepID=UPI001ABC7E94|nr:glycerophosphodiester phosphodiesterase family protein [Roseivirga sp. E12]MBO3699181.1 glycerophosphodiester phosphodiesterase family protein [Roseivirga sp. E12]
MRTLKHFSLTLIIAFTLCSCGSNTEKSVEEDGQGMEAMAMTLYGAKDFYSWTEDRVPMVSAHRGGPYPGYPENSLRTFDYVLSFTPAVIECDIAMTADSVLVMMHDNTLDRTTNGTGKVGDIRWEDLKSLRLEDNEGNITEDGIPTLEEVLLWADGKALLTLDVKRGVPLKMVTDLVEATHTENYAAIITYNANAAKAVYELNPDLMISVGIGNMSAYEAHRNIGIPDENMIAFTGVSEPEPSLYKFLHDKGIYAILGVLGNLDKMAIAKGDSIYAGFVNRGADILATDRPIEAARVLEKLKPSTSSKFKYFRE